MKLNECSFKTRKGRKIKIKKIKMQQIENSYKYGKY